MIVTLVLLVLCVPQIIVLAGAIWRARQIDLPPVEVAKMRQVGPMGSSSVTPIIDYSTTIFVGLTLGPSAAGAYFAADRLAKLLNIALVGIEQIAAPMLARSYHAGRSDEVRVITAATSAMAFTAALAGGLGDPYWAASRSRCSIRSMFRLGRCC